jgi:heptaprenyl diphosphate synthase
MSLKNLALLVVIKTLVQGLISGTLFSYVFLFSAAGSSAAAVVMGILYYCCVKNKNQPLISLVGMSVAGALGNNGAQLLVARYVIFGEAARYIAPVLLCSGLVTGLALGIATQKFVSLSRWYKSLEAIS